MNPELSFLTLLLPGFLKISDTCEASQKGMISITEFTRKPKVHMPSAGTASAMIAKGGQSEMTMKVNKRNYRKLDKYITEREHVNS